MQVIAGSFVESGLMTYLVISQAVIPEVRLDMGRLVILTYHSTDMEEKLIPLSCDVCCIL